MANPNTIDGQVENNQITYAEAVQEKLIQLRSRKTHVLARLKAENKLKPKTLRWNGQAWEFA